MQKDGTSLDVKLFEKIAYKHAYLLSVEKDNSLANVIKYSFTVVPHTPYTTELWNIITKKDFPFVTDSKFARVHNLIQKEEAATLQEEAWERTKQSPITDNQSAAEKSWYGEKAARFKNWWYGQDK